MSPNAELLIPRTQLGNLFPALEATVRNTIGQTLVPVSRRTSVQLRTGLFRVMSK